MGYMREGDMKHLLAVAAAMLVTVLGVNASEQQQQQGTVRVQIATMFKPQMRAPSLLLKVDFHYLACGEMCGFIHCYHDQRPEIDSKTGKCTRCTFESENGQRC